MILNGCSPIRSWEYFDRYGQRQNLSHLITRGNTAALSSPPYQLTQSQYDRLLAVSEPDMVLAQLRRIIPDEIRRVPYTALYPFVEHHTHIAAQYGAATLDEQVQYVLVALYTSGQCRTHEVFIQRQRYIAQSADTPALGDWLQGLPDSLWEKGSPLWDMGHAT